MRTVYSGQSDLGTGVRTAMAQIEAEELDFDMARVRVVQGDTLLTSDQGLTAGSLSVRVGGMQLRQAAPQHVKHSPLKQPDASDSRRSLVVEDGVVRSMGAANHHLRAISRRKAVSVQVDKNAPLKHPDSYTVVGWRYTRKRARDRFV
jgi:nicotinate dehydrogenase subunit B